MECQVQPVWCSHRFRVRRPGCPHLWLRHVAVMQLPVPSACESPATVSRKVLRPAPFSFAEQNVRSGHYVQSGNKWNLLNWLCTQSSCIPPSGLVKGGGFYCENLAVLLSFLPFLSYSLRAAAKLSSSGDIRPTRSASFSKMWICCFTERSRPGETAWWHQQRLWWVPSLTVALMTRLEKVSLRLGEKGGGGVFVLYIL